MRSEKLALNITRVGLEPSDAVKCICFGVLVEYNSKRSERPSPWDKTKENLRKTFQRTLTLNSLRKNDVEIYTKNEMKSHSSSIENGGARTDAEMRTLKNLRLRRKNFSVRKTFSVGWKNCLWGVSKTLSCVSLEVWADAKLRTLTRVRWGCERTLRERTLIIFYRLVVIKDYESAFDAV